jgi:hypothetical protein
MNKENSRLTLSTLVENGRANPLVERVSKNDFGCIQQTRTRAPRGKAFGSTDAVEFTRPNASQHGNARERKRISGFRVHAYATGRNGSVSGFSRNASDGARKASSGAGKMSDTLACYLFKAIF